MLLSYDTIDLHSVYVSGRINVSLRVAFDEVGGDLQIFEIEAAAVVEVVGG
jgi:hypothetical protein